MAFISQDEKKELAPAIKAVLKKYDMKGTIAISNHSTLIVNLKEGALDLLTDDRTYCQINAYNPSTPFAEDLIKAMKGDKWFDKSDMTTDYFHTAYYLRINVGSFEKPYICTKKAA